jgi:hypothetical protein
MNAQTLTAEWKMLHSFEYMKKRGGGRSVQGRAIVTLYVNGDRKITHWRNLDGSADHWNLFIGSKAVRSNMTASELESIIASI